MIKENQLPKEPNIPEEEPDFNMDTGLVERAAGVICCFGIVVCILHIVAILVNVIF